MAIFNVSAKSDPKAVAGAIAAEYKNSGDVELNAIGAGAVNQAFKAGAIVRGMLAAQGYNLVIIPAFGDTKIDDESRTVMRFIIANLK